MKFFFISDLIILNIFFMVLLFFLGYCLGSYTLKFYNKIEYSINTKYIRYIEILSGISTVFIFFKYGLSFNFCIYALLSCILISMSFIDLEYMEIPDETNVSILFLGLLQLVINYTYPLEFFLGFLVAGGIFLLIALFTNGSIGGGDIKLIACIGLVLGLKASIFIALYSSILSFIGLAYALIIKKQSINSFIPYGPFIALSTFYFLLI